MTFFIYRYNAYGSDAILAAEKQKGHSVQGADVSIS
jgi:hypothetical protein